MLKRIHINQKIDGKVFFTSDLHGKHSKDFILNPRGYKDVEEAYSHLFKSWNETVNPNDIVFNLGDWVVGAGTNSLTTAKEMIHGLNGKIYTLFGNHTAGVKQLYRDTLNKQYGFTDESVEVYPVNYENKFIFLGDYVEVIIDGQLCVLSHYAIGSWNEMGKGSLNLHGHSHGSYRNGLPTDLTAKQLDVGWDVFRKPIYFDEIKRIMQKKQCQKVDHH